MKLILFSVLGLCLTLSSVPAQESTIPAMPEKTNQTNQHPIIKVDPETILRGKPITVGNYSFTEYKDPDLDFGIKKLEGEKTPDAVKALYETKFFPEIFGDLAFHLQEYNTITTPLGKWTVFVQKVSGKEMIQVFTLAVNGDTYTIYGYTRSSDAIGLMGKVIESFKLAEQTPTKVE